MNNSPLAVRPNRRRMATIKKRPVSIRIFETVGAFFSAIGEAFSMLSGALGFLLFVGLCVFATLSVLGYLILSLHERLI